MVKLVDGGIYIARNGERVEVEQIRGNSFHSFYSAESGYYYSPTGMVLAHKDDANDLIAEWKAPAPDLDRMRWEAALAAMQGMLASQDEIQLGHFYGREGDSNLASLSFKFADAMLVAGGYKKESEEE